MVEEMTVAVAISVALTQGMTAATSFIHVLSLPLRGTEKRSNSVPNGKGKILTMLRQMRK